MDPSLLCNQCSCPLVGNDQEFVCRNCGPVARRIDGVIRFDRISDHHDNMIEVGPIEEFLQAATQLGWENAFYSFQSRLREKANSMFSNMLKSERAGWKFLLPVGETARVLDVGCGWGSVPLTIAQGVRQVVAMDSTRQRLQSLKAMSESMGLNNLVFVNCDANGGLPFPNDAFDIVVVNGVLQWLPESSTGNPEAIQLAFLREVRRVLASSGVAYVGTENRLSHIYVGHREDHTGLRWSSFMPRFMASLYSKLKRNRPYRTYTYSNRGYRKLFRRAGFDSLRSYSPLPDYRYPKEMVDLDATVRSGGGPRHVGTRSAGSRRRRLKSVIGSRLRASRGFLRRFGHSFSLVASRTASAKRPFLESLLRWINQELGTRDVQCNRYLIRTSTTLLFCSGSKRTVVRIPLDKLGELRVRANAESLRFLESVGIPGSAVAFPKLELEGSLHGQYLTVESVLPGRDFREHPDSMSLAVLEDLARFLGSLGEATRSDSSADWQEFTDTMTAMVETVSKALLEPELRSDFDSLASDLLDRLGPQCGTLILNHGDFNLGNCLWQSESDRVLSGVIDWDQMSRRGLAGGDLLCLFAYRRRRAKHLSWGMSWADLIVSEWSTQEQTVWEDYASKFRTVDVRTLSLATWLRGLYVGFSFAMRNLNYDWVEKNVRSFMANAARTQT